MRGDERRRWSRGREEESARIHCWRGEGRRTGRRKEEGERGGGGGGFRRGIRSRREGAGVQERDNMFR